MIKTPIKEQILKAADKCPEAKEILKELFPDAFKETKVNLCLIWVLLDPLDDISIELVPCDAGETYMSLMDKRRGDATIALISIVPGNEGYYSLRGGYKIEEVPGDIGTFKVYRLEEK